MIFKMKAFLLIALIALPVIIWCGNITLNEYGHIVDNGISEETAGHYLENGLYMTRVDNLTLAGNSFFRTATGYLTLTTLEENVPTELRLYKDRGKLIWENEFRRVINIHFSENREYAVFYDGRNCISLDLSQGRTRAWKGKAVFSITNSGAPVLYDETTFIINFKQKDYLFDQPVRKIVVLNDLP